MVNIKKSTTINAGEGMEEKETSYLLMGIKSIFMKENRTMGHYKLNTEVLKDPAIPLLCRDPEKTIILKDRCTLHSW